MIVAKNPVYLDYNATTPLRPEVTQMLVEKLPTLTGNPSSIHAYGRQIRKEIEKAREQVAKLIQADPIDVVFTSGATEANNAVIAGAPVTRILYSAIEHPSVMEPAAKHKNSFVIPVLPNGQIDLAALENLLAQEEPTLVSVMWVNNETGVIQPVEQIAVLAKKYNALFHCDAVQAAGKIPVRMADLGINYLTLSAHKIGGPSGIGALVYNHNTKLEKFISGGGQERRRRAGTENVIGALGFGLAAELAQQEENHLQQLAQWRDLCEARMQEIAPNLQIIGKDSPRVPNTIQLVLPGISAETHLMGLDLEGIAVSSGSACSSGSIKPSHVLLAMGVSDALARCAIRVSMGFGTTQKDVDYFLSVWVANVQRLIKS